MKNLTLPNCSIGWKTFQVYLLRILLYACNTAHRRTVALLETVQRHYQKDSKRLNGLAKNNYMERLHFLRAL